MKIILFLSVNFLIVNFASAQDRGAGWCGSTFKSIEVGCNNISLNGVGGSYPLIFDAFNVNSASLPDFVTPVGVEAFYDGSRFNYSLIKGFKGVGSGVSVSTTEAMFFSPASKLDDAIAKIESSTNPAAANIGQYTPNYNAGLSINLFGPNQGIAPRATIGGSTRYNYEERNWNYEGSLVLKNDYISIGVSYTKKPFNEELYSYNVGLRLQKLFAEFTYFEDFKMGYRIETTITSFNYSLWGFQITAGFRKQENPLVTEAVKQQLQLIGQQYNEYDTMMGATYRIKEKFTLGLISNYVLGKGTSLVAQYFF